MFGNRSKAALVSALLLCTACASEAEQPVALATADDTAKVAEILNSPYSPQGDRLNYELVRNNAARACLRAMGHRAEPLPVGENEHSVNPWRESLQWVASGNTHFAEYVQDPANFTADAPLVGSQYALSEEAGKQFWGFPEESVDVDYGTGGSNSRVVSGCYGQVVQEVFGVDASTYEKTVAQTRQVIGLARKVAEYPAIRDLSGDYSRCMKKAGFTTPAPAMTPEELSRLVKDVEEGTAQPKHVADKEQEFNRSDSQCKEKSGVSRAFAAAYLAEYEAAQQVADAARVDLQKMHNHAREYASNA